MNNGLFRQSSLDKISSPEQVNDYIKTSNPGVWVIFLAASLILVGVIVWGVFGTVDITVSSVTVCEDGNVNCYISEMDIENITKNTIVYIGDKEFNIENISKLPVLAKDEISQYGLHVAGFSEDEWVYECSLTGDLPDDIYKSEIVIKSVSPISLLLN